MLVYPGANAANHALLIGIGQYKTRTLEGPPHDVAALQSVLASKYDFKRENIRALINQDAVKSRILNEIEQLAASGIQEKKRALAAANFISGSAVVPHLEADSDWQEAAQGIHQKYKAALAGQKPILGVCLGHQSIGQVFGGKIVHAGEIMHGKTSPVFHTGVGVFEGIDSPFIATRYHSLVIEKGSLPDCLEVTAWTQDEEGEIDEIMGVRHKEIQIEGVQFHPESILTDNGHALLYNFLQQSIT